MLNIDEVYEEIKKLENCEYTTYDICKKLAILYVVKDHYKPAQVATKSSMDLDMSKSPIK